MDIQILLVLQALRQSIGGCLNNFFAFITTVAVDYYIMLPGMILFWAMNKRAGLIGLGSYGAACYGVSALKSTFCVYRPWVRSSLIEPLPEVMSGATGYSFPSGHSASVSGMYGGLIAAYRKHNSNIWTTALSISANCTQKRLTVKFWEKPNTVLVWQF